MGQRFASSCLITAALLFGGAGSEAQNLEWVHGFGNASIQPWVLEVPEGSSDVSLAGSFQGTQDFNHSLGTATLQSSGFSDAFVAKYDSSGQFAWVQALDLSIPARRPPAAAAAAIASAGAMLAMAPSCPPAPPPTSISTIAAEA